MRYMFICKGPLGGVIAKPTDPPSGMRDIANSYTEILLQADSRAQSKRFPKLDIFANYLG